MIDATPNREGWFLARHTWETCEMYPVEVVQTPLYLRAVPRQPGQPQHMFPLWRFTWGEECGQPEGVSGWLS